MSTEQPAEQPPEQPAETGAEPQPPLDADDHLAEGAAPASDLQDQLLRSQAELDNVRKRLLRDMESERKYASLPLLQDLNTNEVAPVADDEKGGLPIAIDAWDYQSYHTDLPPNSRLLIYTDGLDEAFPPDGDEHEQFGMEGIIKSLQSSAKLPLEDAMQKLFSDSSAYTRGQGRLDDTSVLLVER